MLDISQLKYVVLPGALTHQSELRFHYNQAYLFYKNIWQRIFNRLDGPGSYDADGFYRSSQISTLFYGDTVVGQICCRELHMDNMITEDVRYFQVFKGKATEEMRQNRVKKVLTLEANALNPAFSKRKTGFPFTEISMQLSIKLAKSLGMECCTGTPRTLTGVQNTAVDMGFHVVESHVMSHNCPVDVVLCYVDNLKTHADPQIASTIEHLWNTRIDYRFPNLAPTHIKPFNKNEHGERTA